MSIPPLPHEAPKQLSTFTSTYDARFGRPSSAAAVASTEGRNWVSPTASGYLRNANTQLARPHTGLRGNVSTAHSMHCSPAHNGDGRASALANTKPRRVATAHLRNNSGPLLQQPDHAEQQGQDGGGMTSEAQAAYGNPRDTPLLSSQLGRMHHPGSAAVMYRRDFLYPNGPHNNEPENYSPKRAASAAARSNNNSPGKFTCVNSRDGPLHIALRSSNALQYPAPLHPHSQMKLKIRDPVEYHVYKNQRPWVTQNSIYGDKSTAQLLSTGAARSVRDVVTPEQARMVANKRSLLNLLAGRASTKLSGMEETAPMARAGGGSHQIRVSADEDTNPILLSPAQSAKVVTHRLETEGNVKQTMAHSEFTNKWLLPEQASSVQSLAKAKKITYFKYPVDPRAAQELENVVGADGTLVSEKPPHVHATTWTLLKMREKFEGGSRADPHAHKKRVVIVK